MTKSIRQLLLAPVLILSASLAAAQVLPAWEAIDVPQDLGHSITASGASGRVQLATARYAGALRSNDIGRTWQALRIGSESPNFALGHPVHDDIVYAAIAKAAPESAYTPPIRLYQSRDGGLTWRGGEPRLDNVPVVLGEIRAGSHADLLFASRLRETICMISCAHEPVEALVSIDAGANWRSIDRGIGGKLRRVYPAASDPAIAYAVTDTGVWATRDLGVAWRHALAATNLLQGELLVDRLDPSLVYVREWVGRTLRVSEDGGLTWRTAEHPDEKSYDQQARLTADPVQRGRLYYRTADGRVYESRDRAGTWRPLTLANPRSGLVWDGPVGVEGTARIFTAGSSRVLVEDDGYAIGSNLWWNPALSGMGLSITQHASGQIFAVWFAYGADGSPTWYVLPGGRWIDRHTFESTLYTARGMPAGAGYDPARHSTARVGTATLSFVQGVRGTFRYRFDDGRQGEMAIEPQPFGSGVGPYAARDFADLWWNEAQPGWGLGIAHQKGRVFLTWFTYDATGAPTWAVVSDARVEGVPDTSPAEVTAAGTLYATRGPSSAQAYDPAAVTVREVGNMRLTWGAGTQGPAILRIEAFGRAPETITLRRQPF